MPDDHSKVVPLLPIPNRTVKRLSADDSADSRVKVGHRQAITASKPPVWIPRPGVLSLGNRNSMLKTGNTIRPVCVRRTHLERRSALRHRVHLGLSGHHVERIKHP